MDEQPKPKTIVERLEALLESAKLLEAEQTKTKRELDRRKHFMRTVGRLKGGS